MTRIPEGDKTLADPWGWQDTGWSDPHPLSRTRDHNCFYHHRNRNGYFNPSPGPDWQHIRWKCCDFTIPTTIRQRWPLRVDQKDAPSSWACPGQTSGQSSCGPARCYWEYCLLDSRHLGEGHWMACRAPVGPGDGCSRSALHGCPWISIPSASKAPLGQQSIPPTIRAVFSPSCCWWESVATELTSECSVHVLGDVLQGDGVWEERFTSPANPVSTPGAGTGVLLILGETLGGCPTGAITISLL